MLVPALLFIALVVAVVGSLGAPLITSVAGEFGVSLATAQWTLTAPLLVGAIATPVLGRLGAGPRRRQVILATLAVVVAGSLLAVVPPSFGWLLAGRVAQGAGLGLTALMMGVARDHLPAARSGPTIALLSVASTVGIGVGYPLAGLLTDMAGLRAAYGLGLLITTVALAAAWRSVPQPPTGRSAAVDVPGAVLLGSGLVALLLAIGQTTMWTDHPVFGAALLVDRRLADRHLGAPGTPVRRAAGGSRAAAQSRGGGGQRCHAARRHRHVPAADPGDPVRADAESAGYGFGVDVFVAGLVLVPFSVLGFVGGKLVRPLRVRLAPATVLAAGGTAVLVALVVFALARSQLWHVVRGDGRAGLGRRCLLGSHARRDPRRHPGGGDLQRDELQPGGPQRRVLHRQRAGRPDPGRAYPGRLNVPHRQRIRTASWIGAAAMGVTVVAALTLRQAPNSTTTGLQSGSGSGSESGLRKG